MKPDIETIFILQRRAVRSIYKLKLRETLREKFKEIGILTVASQYIYNNIVFIRQHISLYKQKIDINSRLTRNGHKLVTPAYRLRKLQKSFVGLSVRFYNMIPKVILDLPMHKFKECVKHIYYSEVIIQLMNFLMTRLLGSIRLRFHLSQDRKVNPKM